MLHKNKFLFNMNLDRGGPPVEHLLKKKNSSSSSSSIVKFTQLCSKFPPTALLSFACDWLALDKDG